MTNTNETKDWRFCNTARQADADFRLMRGFNMFQCGICGRVLTLDEAAFANTLPPSLNNGGHIDICKDCVD